jgi:hypothetical protein
MCLRRWGGRMEQMCAILVTVLDERRDRWNEMKVNARSRMRNNHFESEQS